ncbi:MAG: hypothetical protein JWM27_3015 [Gemmatimonadetes bacterium]|nr:hypothetical protein [Gemmatimonadota bacterium]
METVAPPAPAPPAALASADGGSLPRLDGRPQLFTAQGALWAAIAFGIAFRMLQYAANRSLWLDEALVVPSIGQGWRQVLMPSGLSPVAPGWLALEKVVSAVLGTSELALRLVPLLAGVGGLLLFAAIARRILAPGGAAAATAAFAVSPYLVYYSSELKPYSTDVLAALVLTWWALALRARGMTPLRAVGLALGALAVVYCSLPAAFVLAGVVIALLAAYLRAGERRNAAILGAVCAFWALAFLPPLLMVVGHAHALASQAADYAHAFWNQGFMPLPPRSEQDVLWFPHTFLNYFRDPLGTMTVETSSEGFWQAAAGIVAFVAGALALRGERRFALGALLLPIGVALLASGLRLYPFGGNWVTGGRVVLYLAPSFLLLMGAGVDGLRTGLPGTMRPLAWALLAVLLVPSIAQLVTTFPTGRAEIKPLLAYVRANRQPGDLTYVHYDAKYAFAYYGPRMGFTPGEVVPGICARLDPEKYVGAMGRLKGRGRVWVLFTNGDGAHSFQERQLMLDVLNHLGRRLDDQVAVGASVYLYDLSAPPADPSPFSPRLPRYPESVEHGCALWQ